jgi:hypothetical protein
MSNHQQVTIVRDTAETNNETDALAEAISQAQTPATTDAPAQPAQARPEWLPEKFQDPTELAKAYSELERRLSSGSGPLDQNSLETYSKEFSENGDLSDESIQKIAGMGIPEHLVRAYVDGQKALVDTNTKTMMSYAGGEQAYTQIQNWAADNIAEDEIDAFNSIIESGNMSNIKMAIQGLKARYEQANGKQTGRLIQGEMSGPAGGAFRSISEIVEAMKDPRYARDPAYRKDVESRVALSNALGVAR